MKQPFLILTIAAALCVGNPALAQPPDREAELADVLEGWIEAGPPERCINLHRARILRIINQTAVVYRVGDTLYLNRPRSGAQYLDRRDALLNRRGPLYLCDGEMIESTDPFSGIVRLITAGPFIPYRRVD